MNYCVNPEECKKEGVKLKVFLASLSLYLEDYIGPEVFEEMCRKGYVEYDGFDLLAQPINPRLTQSGIDMVETILLNSEFDKPEDKEQKYDSIAEKLRELFPQGKKPGTSHMWRDSVAIISKRLKAAVKKYNLEFTEEEAIEATKRYVESFQGDYTYMHILRYFIFKKDKITGEEVSEFASYLENKDVEDQPVNSSFGTLI